MDDIILQLTGERTDLYPKTQKLISDLHESLETKKIIPWAFLLTSTGLKITRLDGRQISYSGIKFSGSPEQVFWTRFIEPFLEDGIINILDTIAEDCLQGSLDPTPHLEEAVGLYKIMTIKVYRRMVQIDRNLRGEGFPEKATPKDANSKIASMERFIDGQLKVKKALLLKKRPDNWTEKIKLFYNEHQFFFYILALILTIAGIYLTLQNNNIFFRGTPIRY